MLSGADLPPVVHAIRALLIHPREYRRQSAVSRQNVIDIQDALGDRSLGNRQGWSGSHLP